MASPTYKDTGIVLRKTRLGESDLIVELLDEKGCKLKLVAKGARKPNGRFSAHLELFNTCELLCVKGKNLDIATESRLVDSRAELMFDPSRMYAASSVAELLSLITQPSLEQPRLFDLTQASLQSMISTQENTLSLSLAAAILKTVAFAGLKPSLNSCAMCATHIDLPEYSSAKPLSSKKRDIRFSHNEGGVVCAECAKQAETVWVDQGVIALAQKLMMSRFSEISAMSDSVDVTFELLQLLQMWVATHIGTRLKSLSMFMDMQFIRS